jgi:RNA polymerase sigma-B factor
LDAPREDGDEEVGTLADSLGVEDGRFELIEFGATIAPAARQLSERERRVLALRFLEDRTQSEIAEQIGVSQMQVSRILRQSVARLGELIADGGSAS